MICSRRLYKGNSYEICLPLTDTGVTMVRFYTRGDVIIEKEPEISGDSMCFSFMPQELASLEDGVLRYQIVTEYETVDTNSPYVIVTPGDYSGETLDDLIEEAFESGYTAGYDEAYEECHPDYTRKPLTFEIISGGTIFWGDSFPAVIEYSMDSGRTWSVFSSLTVNAGDIIQFRGSGQTGVMDDEGNGYAASFNNSEGTRFAAYGNLHSLLDGENYASITDLSAYSGGTFLNLFGTPGLVTAENLILPATRLNKYCYSDMFQTCTRLTTAPALPATMLADYCYQSMFNGCTSLTTAPALPATTLKRRCYTFMFNNCRSLTDAPNLPARTIPEGAYYFMFAGCSSLTGAPVMQATQLDNYYGPVHINCMFLGCTSLTTAPDLGISTLTWRNAGEMFSGCTNLNYVKCLATSIEDGSTTNWLAGVSPTGTFVKHPDASWPSGVNGIPTGWTVVDAT